MLVLEMNSQKLGVSILKQIIFIFNYLLLFILICIKLKIVNCSVMTFRTTSACNYRSLIEDVLTAGLVCGLNKQNTCNSYYKSNTLKALFLYSIYVLLCKYGFVPWMYTALVPKYTFFSIL